jgi:hypothetical protein
MICSGSDQGPALCSTIQPSCQANAASILSSSAETLGIQTDQVSAAPNVEEALATGQLSEQPEEILRTFVDELTGTPQPSLQTTQQQTAGKIENIVSTIGEAALAGTNP